MTALLDWLPNRYPVLRSLCTRYQVPLGVAVGWIEVESGGRLAELTRYGERGFFQILPAESIDHCFDHERLSVDAVYSMQCGFVLVDYYRRQIARLAGLTDGSEYQWRLVKFLHSIGIGAATVCIRDAEVEGFAASWEVIRRYLVGRDAHYQSLIRHSPQKWIDLVDRMFEIGAPYGVSLATDGNGGSGAAPNA